MLDQPGNGIGLGSGEAKAGAEFLGDFCAGDGMVFLPALGHIVQKHRDEQRGIGGVFFDDFSELGFDGSFAMMTSVGDAFLDAYLPIVDRRKDLAYSERERDFQLYRRGRYVEFNLVWDRGTHFGLQSGGRSESILLSMPPMVSWSYQRTDPADSAEARLTREFLVRKDWV